MGINITQFAPPGTVSKLVWDDDMEAGAGKIFKGDLTGDVTGNVTGNVTGDVVGNLTGNVTGNVTGNLAGNAYGFIVRNFAYSASSNDVLIIPGGSNTSLNWSKSNAPIFNSTVILGNATNTGVIKLGALGSWDGDDNQIYGHCIITCYDSAGAQLYHYDHIAGASSWSFYDVAIPKDTSRIVITGSEQWSWSDVYAVIDTNVIPGMIPQPTNGVYRGDVVGNVTGNVTGKIIVNGCTWSNNASPPTSLRDAGYILIITSITTASSSVTEATKSAYIAYPYLGVIDFQPKPSSPALTFTVSIAGSSLGDSIGGQLDVYASDNTTVLRSYSKFGAIGTFDLPVDLTDAYRLVLRAWGNTNTTTNVSINNLYVRLPYGQSLVD